MSTAVRKRERVLRPFPLPLSDCFIRRLWQRVTVFSCVHAAEPAKLQAVTPDRPTVTRGHWLTLGHKTKPSTCKRDLWRWGSVGIVDREVSVVNVQSTRR